jgi:hypothetical protein
MDYRTGKPCTREQYIQNGLERGELLYKYDCGCVIIQDRVTDAYIVYCSKHKAAFGMYEALKGIRDFLIEYRKAVSDTSNWPILNKMNEALAKAEGKE